MAWFIDKLGQTWIWFKGKRLAVISAIALLGGGTVALMLQGEPIGDLQVEIIERHGAVQDDYFQEHGKYLQIFEDDDWNAILNIAEEIPYKMKTHEYKTPKQEYGYQLFIKGEGFKNSYGYGPEAQRRTFELIKDLSTSTATTTL